MKRLLPLLVLVVATGVGLWMFLNPIPSPPLPTLTEMQTAAGEQPEEVVRVAATALAWLMWLSLIGYTVTSIRDHVQAVLHETRVEARIEKAQRERPAGAKKARRQKVVIDPQRSITLTVAPREMRDVT